ncbi:VOC family protein [Fodinicurvata sediminis]|uniref:VOC family protein n=1 Tax=Fodinicurvata sediminis TaxID=1121832 RepID=UPI0003B34219|nr:VOC family protein [Fodinicurvata sediminis]
MTQQQMIVPCLWFDDQAEAAAAFYTSLFPDSAIEETTRYNRTVAEIAGRTEGSVMTVGFRLAGRSFTGLNGGPMFRFTPALSLFVSCEDVEQARALFDRLADGGEVLMPFQAYPFSEGYGWVADRFGLTWQVNGAPREQTIAFSLLFTGVQCGRAEKAMNHYTTLFPNSGIDDIWRYEDGEGPDAAGTLKQAVFTLAGQEFRVMDSALDHAFTFTEALSLQVLCDSQPEVDRYWEQLGAGGDPDAQRCGWLKDRFGVSWQVVPRVLPRLMREGDAEQVEQVSGAMLQMKKLDISGLEQAHTGDRP